MNRKPILLPASILIAVLFLVSCDQMFTMNVFKAAGLGQVGVSSADEIGSMSSADAFTAINDAASSPKFFETLEGDSAVKNAYLDKLLAAASDSSLPKAEQEQALVLAASIELETTAASTVVSNIVSSLTSGTGNIDVEETIKSIMPTEITSQMRPGSPAPAEFTEMIEAFSNANRIYTDLGTRIGADASLPSGSATSAGDVAQLALVSYVVSSVESTDPSVSVADALWAAMNPPVGQTSSSPGITTNISIDNLPPAQANLLSAAGLDLASLSGAN